MDHTTTTPPPPPGPDRTRFRSLADTRRATGDRFVAGVGGGLGRHLGIDPVVVRIIFVALTFAGLAGVVLYAACWFLLPSDDGRPSVAADWFNLDRNEPQVRTTGLVIGGVLALVSIVGDSGWLFWGFPGPLALLWLAVPILFVYWLVVVLPRGARPPAPPVGGPAPHEPPVAPPAPAYVPAPRPRPEPPVLLAVTAGATAVVLGALALWGQVTDRDLDWTAYVVTAVLVIGTGLLVGARWGRSYTLLPVGLALCAVLAVGSALPSARVGEFRPSPTTADALRAEYVFGVGSFELDLGALSADDLTGRTVRIEGGVGEVIVLVPREVPVRVDARTNGEIVVFDQREAGRGAEMLVTADERPALVLDIDHTLGQIRVERS